MMTARKKHVLDLDTPADALPELARLAELARMADERATLARAERDALIARTLTNRVATGVDVSAVTGLTQPRCVQIRRMYASTQSGVAAAAAAVDAAEEGEAAAVPA